MASAYRIHVPASQTGLLKWKQNDEAAAKVSELLQMDLETHHVYFNLEGFHNHIVHLLLSLYATGATPETLSKAYAENQSYQLKAMKVHDGILDEIRQGWTNDSPFLGKGKYYPDFLQFFQEEIEKKTWEAVLQEYVFKGDERSEAIFGRLFAGFLHPLIQLMYGIEWQQPALIAAGLAQAAVHENRVGNFFVKIEQDIASSPTSSPQQRRTIPELIESLRQNNEKLATSAHFEDSNKIYDGVFVRAPDEALKFLQQVRVGEDEVDEKVAEMFHSTAYVAAAAATAHPPNVPKFDFFLIHHLNSAPFFITLTSFPWLSASIKARILEWKIRLDIVEYIARGSPPLDANSIKSFYPTTAGSESNGSITQPQDLLPRFHKIMDDGHTIKVVRSLYIIQELSKKYAGRPWLRITEDQTWLKIHQMLLEGAEGKREQAIWVRSTGFDEAWKNVPKAT